jgi:CheY-like chemotaxis protein
MHCILVAEDNKANQIVVAGTLKKLGYAVDIVESGGAAVEACFTNVYAAVLMDVMMPGMDGYEATAKIHDRRSRDRHRGRHERLPHQATACRRPRRGARPVDHHPGRRHLMRRP